MLRRGAVLVDEDALDGDAGAHGVDGVAARPRARADGGDDAPPVGVGAEDGGLHERRAGDGLGDVLRDGARGRPHHVHLDELARSLAVLGDGSGELDAEVDEGVAEDGVVG